MRRNVRSVWMLHGRVAATADAWITAAAYSQNPPLVWRESDKLNAAAQLLVHLHTYICICWCAFDFE